MTPPIASQPDHPDYRYWDSSSAEPVGHWSHPEPGVKVYSEPDGRVTRVWPDTAEMRARYLTA